MIDLPEAKHRGVMPITQGASFGPKRVNFTPLDRSFLSAVFLELFSASAAPLANGGEPHGSIGIVSDVHAQSCQMS
jgi:hypothetical protein